MSATPPPSTGHSVDAGRPAPSSVRSRVSPAARLSRLTATISDRTLGNDVVIAGVSGRGILHMPSTSRSDNLEGLVALKVATHLWLEFARDTFPYVKRGAELTIDGQIYRASTDQETLHSDTSQGTGKYADGEVTMVFVEELRRPIA